MRLDESFAMIAWRLSARGGGKVTHCMNRFPLEWRQVEQWQSAASKGREELGIGKVKVFLPQRQDVWSSVVMMMAVRCRR